MLIGEFIRLKRTEKGWTQTALANKIGAKSPVSIAAWESNRAQPGLTSLKSLAQAFKMKLSKFIKQWESHENDQANTPTIPEIQSELTPEAVKEDLSPIPSIQEQAHSNEGIQTI